MKKNLYKSLLIVAIVGLSNTAKAQCDSIANLCSKHIIAQFISDGQSYRSLLLNSEEMAEFHTTFFGETTYRLAACSGKTDGNLIFNIYDQKVIKMILLVIIFFMLCWSPLQIFNFMNVVYPESAYDYF